MSPRINEKATTQIVLEVTFGSAFYKALTWPIVLLGTLTLHAIYEMTTHKKLMVGISICAKNPVQKNKFQANLGYPNNPSV